MKKEIPTMHRFGRLSFLVAAVSVSLALSGCCEGEGPPAGPDASAEAAPPHRDTDAGCGGACASNQRCVDDIVCRYECTTDADCLRIDARIGQCGPLGLCQGVKN